LKGAGLIKPTIYRRVTDIFLAFFFFFHITSFALFVSGAFESSVEIRCSSVMLLFNYDLFSHKVCRCTVYCTLFEQQVSLHLEKKGA